MREVRLGTLTLGRGPVKVAVPLVGSDRTALRAELDALPDSATDLVEWRIDCLMPFPDTEMLLALARELKQSLGSLPLLITVRIENNHCLVLSAIILQSLHLLLDNDSGFSGVRTTNYNILK